MRHIFHRPPNRCAHRLSASLVGLSLLVALPVQAQTPATSGSAFAPKSITLVVPFTSGTTADALARMLGPALAQQWGASVVTDNRVGASGIIGTEWVAKAAPTGQTLLFTATSHGTVPALKTKLAFDASKSFEPIALLATSALGLVVAPSLGVKSFADFTALTKAKPNGLYYASPGNGVVQHLAMELLLQETHLQMVHVPYKGAAGAMTDLMGGHVQASIVSAFTSASSVNAGQLTMLALMSEERSSAFPLVPTFKELGWPGLVVETWYGVFAPAGTPPAVVNHINLALNQLLAKPETREAFAKLGLNPVGGKPERLANLVAREVPRWRKVVATAHIQPD